MALPSFPKRRPRSVPFSARLSAEAVEQLKTLATEHNLSQADVIECLLDAEFHSLARKSKGQAQVTALDVCEQKVARRLDENRQKKTTQSKQDLHEINI